MFCTQCGRQQRDTSAFCRSCGAKSLFSTPAVQPIATKGRRSKLVALLVGVCVAVLLTITMPIAAMAMRNWLVPDPVPAPEPVNPSTILDGVGQLYGVIVGVSDYQEDSLDIPGPDEGAAEMADMATVLWGEDAHLTLLVNADATKANIRQAVASIASRADKEDVILFYFTGHGNRSCIAPCDATPASFSSCISTGMLDEWLDFSNSDKVIVVIDSCESGGFAQGLSSSGRVVLASCSANESARTELSDYISAALRDPERIDSDGNQLISIEEIYGYVRSQPIYGQHPQMADGYMGELALVSFETQ